MPKEQQKTTTEEEPNYDHIEMRLEDYGGYWESEGEE